MWFVVNETEWLSMMMIITNGHKNINSFIYVKAEPLYKNANATTCEHCFNVQ